MAFNGAPSDSPLVFFTDGARCVHDEIEKTFASTKFKDRPWLVPSCEEIL
jgi:hypothetical protein